ncbi:helix-turn-helix transcriptional regulator [Serratia marcescens]|uniref:helix-turn-helix transcriptional regulator n=1 Tax=Serratia TaxID=613 RepID=UPI002937A507|nr:helix-turn-helix transcriptional regulator [Serratia marcescens]ELQ9442320.1 helix-turn-helix transcriptional regulator [Serratia marcescens]ELT5563080.1 helix-turn-helix transcriptional regulator [Serratia marcescens]MBN5200233.1 helix-turn-helix transcriptional regulator [Serratia marcescens]
MNRLKELRNEAGLSQAALAEAMGVSQGAIAHYEKGFRGMKADSINKLLLVLSKHGVHCTFEDIFPKKKA